MSHPLSPQTLLTQLDAWGLSTTTHWHEAVFRVDEGHDLKANIPGAHTKNLFLKDDKGQLWLISAEQSSHIDLKALPKIIGSGRVSFGSEDRLFDALGVRPGSVTALALINDHEGRVKFILDRVLFEADHVNFHPLTNEATTNLTQSDFRAFLAKIGRDYCVFDFKAMQVLA